MTILISLFTYRSDPTYDSKDVVMRKADWEGMTWTSEENDTGRLYTFDTVCTSSMRDVTTIVCLESFGKYGRRLTLGYPKEREVFFMRMGIRFLYDALSVYYSVAMKIIESLPYFECGVNYEEKYTKQIYSTYGHETRPPPAICYPPDSGDFFEEGSDGRSKTSSKGSPRTSCSRNNGTGTTIEPPGVVLISAFLSSRDFAYDQKHSEICRAWWDGQSWTCKQSARGRLYKFHNIAAYGVETETFKIRLINQMLLTYQRLNNTMLTRGTIIGANSVAYRIFAGTPFKKEKLEEEVIDGVCDPVVVLVGARVEIRDPNFNLKREDYTALHPRECDDIEDVGCGFNIGGAGHEYMFREFRGAGWRRIDRRLSNGTVVLYQMWDRLVVEPAIPEWSLVQLVKAGLPVHVFDEADPATLLVLSKTYPS